MPAAARASTAVAVAASTVVVVVARAAEEDIDEQQQALTSRPATMRFAALTILVLLVAPAAPAEIPSQTTFASADAASRALYDAVKKHDEESIGQILGATQSLAEKRDEERLEREQFAQKYAEMHRLGRERNGRMMLYVGAENWPFPIPLVSHNGAWRFDAAAGEQEILFRRIGERRAHRNRDLRRPCKGRAKFPGAPGRRSAEYAARRRGERRNTDFVPRISLPRSESGGAQTLPSLPIPRLIGPRAL